MRIVCCVVFNFWLKMMFLPNLIKTVIDDQIINQFMVIAAKSPLPIILTVAAVAATTTIMPTTSVEAKSSGRLSLMVIVNLRSRML